MLIECPSCKALVCGACGLVREWPLAGSSSTVAVAGAGRDPWFGLLLWLSAPCCGSVLWAYNTDHLDLIASWVGARHRERGSAAARSGALAAERAPSTMLERLPASITAAKHRDEVLRTTTRLRATVPAGLSERD